VSHESSGWRAVARRLQRAVCRLLSCLDSMRERELALEVFDWLDARAEYATADCFIYARLMSMFNKGSGGLRQALALYNRMKAAGIKPDLVSFNTAITAAGGGPGRWVDRQHAGYGSRRWLDRTLGDARPGRRPRRTRVRD
jgi:hypothetical protein